MNYLNLYPLKKIVWLKSLFWNLRPWIVEQPILCGLWQQLFEHRRLQLSVIPEKFLSQLAMQSVLIPGVKEAEHGQDAPLNDLVFILQWVRHFKPKRILEIGTYRAKTTYALHLNFPESVIVSYDIARVSSSYRDILEKNSNTSLRIANFSKAIEILNEEAFDLIFIDAGHRYQEVIDDTRLALKVLVKGGSILWHDYRINDFFNPGLEVPEALNTLAKEMPIFEVPATTCALFKDVVSSVEAWEKVS
jgi:predicted O-methyltransferase YrrM